MKKHVCILVFCVIFVWGSVVAGQTQIADSNVGNKVACSDDFIYGASSYPGICKIIKYIGDEKHLKIPHTLDSFIVGTIDYNAFDGCSSLISVTIPYHVLGFGYLQFKDCVNLTDIHVDKSNYEFCSIDGVLCDKDGTKIIKFPPGRSCDYAVPESVTSFGFFAFEGCAKLNSINLHENVIDIDLGFLYCDSLTAINVDKDNQYYCSIDGVLYTKDCSVLVRYPSAKQGRYTLLASVNEIDSFAFLNCTNLTGIDVALGSKVFSSKDGVLYDKTFTEIKQIPTGSAGKLFIPSSVEKVDPSLLMSCQDIVSIEADHDNKVFSSRDGVLFNKDYTVLLRCPAGMTGSYEIPSTVRKISENAFNECKCLTDIVFGNNVQTIEDEAFENCTELKSLSLPDSVISIGDRAFYGCTSLINLKLGQGIADIGGYAFSHCDSIENIKLPHTVTSIDCGAFSDCSRLASVTLSDNLKVLPSDTFENCIHLKNVVLGSNIETIENNAFAYCKGIKSVNIPASATEIESGAFFSCSSLSAFSVSPGNEKYSSKDGVLFNKSQTELIRYPYGKSGKYTIPESVREINPLAFIDSYLLTEIRIPSGITELHEQAFTNCINLERIDIAPGNTSYSSKDGVWLNKQQTKLIRYPYAKSGYYQIPKTINNIGMCAFYHSAKLTTIIIPENVRSIDEAAFACCYNLLNVAITGKIREIDNDVFWYCLNLRNVIMPDSIMSIGNRAFSQCNSLEKVHIPQSVNRIRNAAFSFCANLKSINIPDNVNHIGDQAFYGCCNLLNMKITKNVKDIDCGVFAYCSSLESIEIPDSVKAICLDAFRGCSELKQVTVGKGVVDIYAGAFVGCQKLESVNFSGNAPKLKGILNGNSVFDGVNAKVYYYAGTTGWEETLGNLKTFKIEKLGN